jgi:hypothetical protein
MEPVFLCDEAVLVDLLPGPLIHLVLPVAREPAKAQVDLRDYPLRNRGPQLVCALKCVVPKVSAQQVDHAVDVNLDGSDGVVLLSEPAEEEVESFQSRLLLRSLPNISVCR